MGGGGIFDDIVEQGGLNGLAVQLELLSHDLRHRQGVDDIGLAAFALLPLVGLLCKLERRPDMGKIRRRIIAADGFFQMFILFLNGHARSPRFRSAAS